MLKLENISFSYEKGKKVLDDICLSVEKGEVIAILGSSGSGKSTLLHILCGLEAPSEGKIFLNGEDISKTPCDKRNIGLIFQDYALFPHLTVEKNVAFSLASRKDPIVDEMLTLVKMQDYKKRYPYELSGGEKQRVAIARSLAAKPDLLLLDEPFSNLDADLRKQVRGEIKAILQSAGTTALIVTHDIDDAYDLADRILFLKQGRIDRIEINHKI